MSMSRWCSVPGPHTGPAGIRRRLGRGPRPGSCRWLRRLWVHHPRQRSTCSTPSTGGIWPATCSRWSTPSRDPHGTHTVSRTIRTAHPLLARKARHRLNAKIERDGQLLRGFLADGLCTDRGRLASILEGNIARAQAQQCILCHSVCRVEFFVLSLARFPWTYT